MEDDGCPDSSYDVAEPMHKLAGTQGASESVPSEAISHATAADWQKALELVVPSCVVLKVTQTRAFDTEAAGSAYATGFIVDKKRGLILTNRHVVTPGPITAEAIFLNREELPVYPLYYDPVHDFGFVRFDPAKLQFMDVVEVPLAPEAATVGLEVRVVGNDSGEKVSILAGTLARLDRDAPHYSRKGYNDFNTFYLQAASGTKGGSSGSPVIDFKGRVVGLNAGGKNKAAAAYYLPLHRVVRALHLLQGCKDIGSGPTDWSRPVIPRGDLQTTFVFKGFDEVRRLGLTVETEAVMRAACGRPGTCGGFVDTSSMGMLVVDSTVPGGPADGVLEAGDVLVRVNGVCVAHFLPLEALLDDHVGQFVTLLVERGGKAVGMQLKVQDLHAVTPSALLEVGGASLHGLSYQQARNNRGTVGLVYVAEPGYMLGRAGVPKHAILTELAGKPTRTLEAFAAVLGTLPHGARVPLQYFTFAERNRRHTGILHVNRIWYGLPTYWTRDDVAGIWHATTDYPAGAPPVPLHAAPVTSKLIDATMAEDDGEELAAEEPEGGLAECETSAFETVLRPSLVMVEVEIPLVALLDGVHSRSFAGVGLVVHHTATLGLVVVDRNTVNIAIGDIMVSFGAHPAEIPATVRFLHPLHNFAIIAYNPADLTPEARRAVVAARLAAGPALRRGDGVRLAGLNKAMRFLQRASTVTNNSFSVSIAPADVPRFRAVHEEVVKIDHDFGAAFSGVLTHDDGRVRALWASYCEQVDGAEREWCAGLQTHVFAPWVEALRALDPAHPGPRPAGPPAVRTLDAELEPVLLSKAAQFGLPARWVARLTKLDPARRQVLRVRSCVAGSPAARVLKDGDMVLAVGGQPISNPCAVEAIIRNFKLAPSVKSGVNEEDVLKKHSSNELVSTLPTQPYKKLRLANGNAHNPELVKPAAHSAGTYTAGGLPSVPLTICRGETVTEVAVQLGTEDGLGTHQLVHWCGAQLQAPHRAVRELGYLPEEASGVYISRWHHGSPAHRYGLYALHWITEVNGVATPDLDTLLAVTSPLPDHSFVRLRLVHMETAKVKVLSVKLDLRYWPTWQLRLDPATALWTRHTVTPPTDSAQVAA